MDNQNEMVEIQTQDLDPIIVQTYQEMYAEINMIKACQLEDSDKLM